MKYEQNVQVETQEYICFVKRIDGVVAQKNLVSELIRCKYCKWYEMSDEETYCRELGIFDTDPNSYCSYAKRKDNG